MESGIYEDVPDMDVMNFAPVGTILPWVPKPVKDESVTDLSVPEGWHRCDGSTIQAPSIWAGQKTPDLNNGMRFLRGAPDETILTLEDDMMEDHHHNVDDPGHVHEYEHFEVGNKINFHPRCRNCNFFGHIHCKICLTLNLFFLFRGYWLPS